MPKWDKNIPNNLFHILHGANQSCYNFSSSSVLNFSWRLIFYVMTNTLWQKNMSCILCPQMQTLQISRGRFSNIAHFLNNKNNTKLNFFSLLKVVSTIEQWRNFLFLIIFSNSYQFHTSRTLLTRRVVRFKKQLTLEKLP